MNRPSSNSILNSLKGRIWLAVSALAVFNCVCGLGAYLLVSFLVGGAFLSIFITFFTLAFVTMVFGWWLSNDVMRPIESVTFLAKSLERSPSASLPRTTGSVETDELLRTLHRSGQQLQNLIGLMDDVAAGKTEAASMPLESADKLSASFQKLVSKVTDSISAKRDLDSIQTAISSLSSELNGVRNGKLDVTIRSEQPQLKEIADSLRYLINRLSSLALQVQSSSLECERTAADARTALQSAISDLDSRIAALSASQSMTPEAAIKADSIFKELDARLSQARSLQGDFSEKQPDAAGGIDKAMKMRTQVADAGKKVLKLRHRSDALSQLARAAKELSQRSSLIALNSAINTNGAASSAEILSVEIGSLSERAESLWKQMISANESLNGEIADLENEFASLLTGMPQVSKIISSSVHTNNELITIIDELEDLGDRFRVVFEERNVEFNKLSSALESASNVDSTTMMIRESELSVQKLANIVGGLRESVSDLGAPSRPAIAPAGFKETFNSSFLTPAEPAVDNALASSEIKTNSNG